MPADAVVIGAGPNGLVAANVLADAGWDVLVLEAGPEPGGAVRSGALTEPGFTHDLFSAFYPLAAVSPAFAALGLEDHGLRWRHAPLALAHPTPDGRCAVVSRDVEETAASLDAYAPGDGEAWRELYALWERLAPHLLDALLGAPFPPLRAGAALVRALGPRELARFARFGLLPARRLADERFAGAGGGLLLAGNGLHADLTPEAAGSGLYGWLLCSLAQQVGFPAPEGGAGALTAALVARLCARGGRLECGRAVEAVIVRGGRAVAVRTDDGGGFAARRAVLADVGAPALYNRLLDGRHVPPALRDDIARFEYDAGVFKVDWALDAPIPWSAPDARRAGTVHVGSSLAALSRHGCDLAVGCLPAHPFLVVGQYAAADETRQPPGRETAWAYAHVPRRVHDDGGGDGLRGTWDESEAAAFAARIEREVEARAPGFGGLIRGRHVFAPSALEAADRNLVGGALGGGTAQLHQQLVLRPAPGWGRPATPVDGLYLASASAHPGGGVHGAPGANAARAALAHARVGGRLVRRVARTAGRRGAEATTGIEPV